MAEPRLQRITQQRRVILEELRKRSSHPTADELHRQVRRRLPRVSLGTVYRNLDVLARAGLVRRLDLAGGKVRFDGDPSEHYHVRCVECGRVSDVARGQITAPQWPAQVVNGHTITGYRLEFEGVCPQCRIDK